MKDFSSHVCLLINLDSRLSERIKDLISAKMPKEAAKKNNLSILNTKQIKIAAENYIFIGEYLSAFIEYLQLKNVLQKTAERQTLVFQQSKFATDPIDELNAKLEKWWREIEVLTSKWSGSWQEYKNKYKNEIIEQLRKQGIEIENQLKETELMTQEELIQIIKKAQEDGKL